MLSRCLTMIQTVGHSLNISSHNKKKRTIGSPLNPAQCGREALSAKALFALPCY